MKLYVLANDKQHGSLPMTMDDDKTWDLESYKHLWTSNCMIHTSGINTNMFIKCQVTMDRDNCLTKFIR